ncbi:hypothetical protein MKX01_037610, partial [Papaver californicum]
GTEIKDGSKFHWPQTSGSEYYDKLKDEVEIRKQSSEPWLLCNEAAKEVLGNKPKRKGGQAREGIARCTFEDKFHMSDIVFLHAWTQVEVPRFFYPLTAALQPHENSS